MLLTQIADAARQCFQVNWPLGSGEKANNRFSRWQPSWILIGTILAIFDLHITPTLPTKFQVSWPFGAGEEVLNRFSTWWPSWIFDQNDFSYFLSTSHPDATYQVLRQLAQRCRRSMLLMQIADTARRMMDDRH